MKHITTARTTCAGSALMLSRARSIARFEKSHFARHVVRAFVLPCLLALATADARALAIRGTVENGTTGAKSVDAKVVVINPSEGMEEVAETAVKGGRFEFADLPEAGMYMVRVTYGGVEYLTPVQDAAQDVAITVYEPTTSWEGVRIVVPHLAASRRGDFLMIEQLYEITNDTEPAKTIYEKGGAFRFFLPTDMDSLVNTVVSSMGVNVDRTPQRTDTPGIYTIDYPIRPGITRVGFTYVVPYKDTYTLGEKFLQDIAHMTIYAVDPAMKVTSSTHTFDSTEEVHGMSAYTLHGAKAGTEVSLTFTGGDPNFAGIAVEGEGGSGHVEENIIVAMGDENKMSNLLMVTVVLVLAGVVGMALRDRHDPLSDPKVLRGHYNLLVSRLARLDDLHAAQAIPEDAYRAAREDLMGRLGALAMHLRTHGGLHHPSPGEPAHQSKAR